MVSEVIEKVYFDTGKSYILSGSLNVPTCSLHRLVTKI